MQKEVVQPIPYVTDPRFCHLPWAQYRGRVPDAYTECFTSDSLKAIIADLVNYLKPHQEIFGQHEAMVQDVTAQLEAALSLL